MIVIHNEEAMKVYLKAKKYPFTKFMPVDVGGYTYNARLIQNIYKKLKKSGVYITSVSIEQGIIHITFKTRESKGKYSINPIKFNGSVGRAEIQQFPIVF